MSTTPSSRSPERSASVRRLAGLAGVVVLLGALSYPTSRWLFADDRAAELIVVQDVNDDVVHELDAVWQSFVRRFPARQTCIDDVRVELVRSLPAGDARYLVGRSRIEVKIPTTPARFRESVAHELAHHLEHTCDDFVDLRMAIEPLVGGSAATWSGEDGDRWEQIPAERWAEAVTELVNGGRVRHADEIVVGDDVLELIARWGRGESIR